MLKTVFVAIVSVFVVSTSQADGLSIQPGMWETTMTRTNPLTGAPQTSVETECITPENAEFDPREMMEGAAECTLTENNLSGNTLTFALSCNMQGAEATANGRMVSNGDTGNGEILMQMSFGGQTMNMEMQWDGRRTGDC